MVTVDQAAHEEATAGAQVVVSQIQEQEVMYLQHEPTNIQGRVLADTQKLKVQQVEITT